MTERSAPPDARSPSRRRLLSLAGATLASGCVGSRTTRDGSGSTTPSSDDDESASATADGESAPAGSWPQLGRDAGHRGYNPTIDAEEPSLRWKTDREGIFTTPTVVDGTVYVTRGVPAEDGPSPVATLEAYDLRSGEREWSEPLGFRFAFHAPNSDYLPVYHRGRLYLLVTRENGDGEPDEGVTAMDPETRERYWTTTFDGTLASDPPVVTDDAVYLGLLGGREAGALVCLNHDGTERWRFGTGETGGARVPAVANDAVYAATGEVLYALDPSDGAVRWRHRNHDVSSESVVATDDELVRASAFGEKVEAVEPDGSKRWEVTSVEGAIVRAAVANGKAYVASLEGGVAAHDLRTGAEVWRTRIGPGASAQGTVPVVTNGAVLAVRANREKGAVVVHALDWDTGDVRWRLRRAGVRARGPIPADGAYLVATQQGAGNLTTGGDLDSTGTLWAFAP